MKRTIDTIAWSFCWGLILGLALVWLIPNFSAKADGEVQSKIQWSNAEALKWQDQKWKEHCRQYGVWASNVMFGYTVNTNWAIAHVQSGTNWCPVELGFRNDGVVVWRTR